MTFLARFRSPDLLGEHFDEHGNEFQADDENAYLALAIAFLGGVKNAQTLECTRRLDGTLVRYNFVTQEFGIVSTEGYILTYFKPDPAYHGKATNRAYFKWECERRR